MSTPNRIPLLVAQLPDADALLPYLRQIDVNRWYTNFGPLAMQLSSERGCARQFYSLTTRLAENDGAGL